MTSILKGDARRCSKLLPVVAVASALLALVSAQAGTEDSDLEMEADVDVVVHVIVSEPVVKSASQEESLSDVPSEVQLSVAEMCKTEEGRQLLLNDEDARAKNDRQVAMSLQDQKFQWQGLRANGEPTEATFEEFRRAALHRRCFQPPLATFQLSLGQPMGTCDNVKFGPPHYDVDGTVQRVRELATYYHTSKDPWVGANLAERTANLKKSIAALLGSIEADLRLSYANTGCRVGNTGRCASHTGQKRVCERVYIFAPPYQVLVPESLKGGQHVKKGPVLESPTKAWFRVGKTGHGENWGTATAESKFDAAGAATKSRLDVDEIRRALVKQGLPVDQAPAQLPTRAGPTPKPEVKPAEPARISVRGTPRGNFYDVYARNDGGSTGTVSFRLWYYDTFFQASKPKWKEKVTVSFPLEAGKDWSYPYHDFHSGGWHLEPLQ